MAFDGWIQESMERLELMQAERDRLAAGLEEGSNSSDPVLEQQLANLDREIEELYGKIEAAADEQAESTNPELPAIELEANKADVDLRQHLEDVEAAAAANGQGANGQGAVNGAVAVVAQRQPQSSIAQAPVAQAASGRGPAKAVASWTAKAQVKVTGGYEKVDSKARSGTTGKHTVLSTEDARKALSAKLQARKVAKDNNESSASGNALARSAAPTQELSLPVEGPMGNGVGVPSLAKPLVVPAAVPSAALSEPMRVPTGLFDTEEIHGQAGAPVVSPEPSGAPTLAAPASAAAPTAKSTEPPAKAVAFSPRPRFVVDPTAVTKPVMQAAVARPTHHVASNTNEHSQVTRLLAQVGEHVHALEDQISAIDQAVQGARKSMTEQERRSEAAERARAQAEAEAARIAAQTQSAQEATKLAAQELARNEEAAKLAAERLSNAQQRLRNLERMGELLRDAKQTLSAAEEGVQDTKRRVEFKNRHFHEQEAALAQQAEKAIETAEVARMAADRAQEAAEAAIAALDALRDSLSTRDDQGEIEVEQAQMVVVAARERHDMLLREMERLAAVDEEVDAALDSLEIERLAADDSVATAKARAAQLVSEAGTRTAAAPRAAAGVETQEGDKAATRRTITNSRGKRNGRSPAHRGRQEPARPRTVTAPLIDETAAQDHDARERPTASADDGLAADDSGAEDSQPTLRRAGEYPAIRGESADDLPALGEGELGVRVGRFNRTSKTVWSVVGVLFLAGFAGQMSGIFDGGSKGASTGVSAAAVGAIQPSSERPATANAGAKVAAEATSKPVVQAVSAQGEAKPVAGVDSDEPSAAQVAVKPTPAVAAKAKPVASKKAVKAAPNKKKTLAKLAMPKIMPVRR